MKNRFVSTTTTTIVTIMIILQKVLTKTVSANSSLSSWPMLSPIRKSMWRTVSATATFSSAPRPAFVIPGLNTIRRGGGSTIKTGTTTAMRAFTSTLSPIKNNNTVNRPSIKKWPKPCYTCNGDYRQEIVLEKHIGGPLYEYQDKLPKLPIPTIEESLERLKRTAYPLATTQKERQELDQACANFPLQAQHLQERLIERQQNDMANSSWLQIWWNQMGYLQVRDPVVIYVSYFFLLQDDYTLPSLDGNSSSGGGGGSPIDTSYNACIERGAAALCTTAKFRNLVASGMLPTEIVGKQKVPLCSSQKKYLFHTCRIPKPKQDEYKMYDPSIYKHTIVACRGKFYKIPIVHPDTNEPFELATYQELLNEVVRKACYTGGGGTSSSNDMNNNLHSLPIGLLTTSNRDEWATARSQLVSLGGGERMEQALTELESGALLLCLDLDDEVYSLQQKGRHYWYGSPWNRWFDKSAQIIVTKNGKMGYIGEHAMMDGMPAIRFCNALVDATYKRCLETKDNVDGHSSSTTLTSPVADSVQDIFEDTWAHISLDNKREIQGLITKAKDEFANLTSEHELHINTFLGYGSDFMKKSGHSPDAYFQVAVQLATYRLFGKQVGTYESTQVRPFLHGRTETTRSVTLESQAFVEQMGLNPKHDEHDPTARKKKLELFQEATQAHRVYTGDAASGMGVDRHFLGLSMCVKDGEEAPSLFSDPLFIRSKRWRVSSSTTPHCPGFGEVVSDGVGLGYLVKSEACIYTVSSLKENEYTEAFVHLLEESLLEIRTLIELDKETPESKL